MKSLMTLFNKDARIRVGSVWNHIHDGEVKYTILEIPENMTYMFFKVEGHEGKYAYPNNTIDVNLTFVSYK